MKREIFCIVTVTTLLVHFRAFDTSWDLFCSNCGIMLPKLLLKMPKGIIWSTNFQGSHRKSNTMGELGNASIICILTGAPPCSLLGESGDYTNCLLLYFQVTLLVDPRDPTRD